MANTYLSTKSKKFILTRFQKKNENKKWFQSIKVSMEKNKNEKQ